MKIIEVKSQRPHFNDRADGIKKAEIRIDDRDYQVGDILVERAYNAENDHYSNEYIISEITHILRDFVGLQQGYALLSLKQLASECCPF